MKVTAIIPGSEKGGMGKNGKPWSSVKVEIDDGFAQTYIFQPIAIGDEVEAYENNGYTNYRKVKQGSMEIATIINMLQDMTKKLDQLLGSEEL